MTKGYGFFFWVDVSLLLMSLFDAVGGCLTHRYSIAFTWVFVSYLMLRIVAYQIRDIERKKDPDKWE